MLHIFKTLIFVIVLLLACDNIELKGPNSDKGNFIRKPPQASLTGPHNPNNNSNQESDSLNNIKPYSPYKSYKEYTRKITKSFCENQPSHTNCSGTASYCQNSPGNYTCKGTKVFCQNSISDQSCRGTEIFCLQKPFSTKCYGTKAYCQQRPKDSNCPDNFNQECSNHSDPVINDLCDGKKVSVCIELCQEYNDKFCFCDYSDLSETTPSPSSDSENH